jgi:hypothetical protein
MVGTDPIAEGNGLDLSALNEALAAQGYPFKLAFVPLERLRLLDKNARFMSHEMFQNLVDNVQRDGGLSSVPFCWFDGDVYHVLSGNHRVKAAQTAGVASILILYDDRPLSRQEFVARQLSHNAIEGQDDPAILRELWREIEDVALKYYAGLDDKTLNLLADASIDSLAEARLDFRAVSFLFLPEEAERLREAFRKAAETTIADEGWAARLDDFGRTLDALDKAKASFAIHNAATALMLVLDIFEAHQQDLAAGWLRPDDTVRHKGQVPIASVLGTDRIPSEVAWKLQQVAKRLQAKEKIGLDEQWKVIEALVDNYISSGK